MKRKLILAFVWVLVVGFLLTLMPWSRTISVQTIAYEYALDQKEPLQTHTVTVDGRYYPSLWGIPYFDGTFAVSGFAYSLEEPVRINFNRSNGGVGMLYYRDAAGQPRSTELNQIRMEESFSHFAVMVFEVEEKEDHRTCTWTPETGHILCTDAPDYAALQTQCEKLGFDFWEGE